MIIGTTGCLSWEVLVLVRVLFQNFKFGSNSYWYSGLHFAGVPLAGNSTRFGPDTSEFRDYPFGGGWEGRIEERINIWQLGEPGI
jgi:hypothetical protein